MPCARAAAHTDVLRSQIINYENLFKREVTSLPKIENEHVRLDRTYLLTEPDAPFLFKATLTAKNTNSRFITQQTLFALMKSTVRSVLRDTGFHSIQFFGAFNEVPVSIDTIPLIFCAEK